MRDEGYNNRSERWHIEMQDIRYAKWNWRYYIIYWHETTLNMKFGIWKTMIEITDEMIFEIYMIVRYTFHPRYMIEVIKFARDRILWSVFPKMGFLPDWDDWQTQSLFPKWGFQWTEIIEICGTFSQTWVFNGTQYLETI